MKVCYGRLKPPTLELWRVNRGDCFMLKNSRGAVYMRCDINYNDSKERICCVSLEAGNMYLLEQNKKVIPVEATVHIGKPRSNSRLAR